MESISSRNIEEYIEYSQNDRIAGTGYQSFLKCLAKTIEKELPVELRDNSNGEIIKVNIKEFVVDYQTEQEGNMDNLTLEFVVVGEENQQTLAFVNTGKFKVKEDAKSGPRSFYRYEVDADNDKGYRFTFNRRITKD
ncbi:hypothetical protein Amet_3732 [Alkaliphilus metalliredigens QYMF]|uniref:Uncharacterized protein n=1 Tax=Alkaliphilus metalliredigens (strain QYMF) TaxID=293826 RepID=A6TUI3_ALKMQ|nr:hypothetical protein [Alkaliphilus metalliredigens]ABR49851.1 hypothetical protein Amet_3732 [Alkaliphilus metalliredigens QYMF]